MNPYALLAALVALLVAVGGAYFKGRHDEHASHLEQIVADTNEARRIEQRAATHRQETEDALSAELRGVNARLADALERVRQRPERLPEAARAACAGSTGRELSGRDAAAFERLAARADTIRAELAACQAREQPLSP
jgi:hypothetical protein